MLCFALHHTTGDCLLGPEETWNKYKRLYTPVHTYVLTAYILIWNYDESLQCEYKSTMYDKNMICQIWCLACVPLRITETNCEKKNNNNKSTLRLIITLSRCKLHYIHSAELCLMRAYDWKLLWKNYYFFVFFLFLCSKPLLELHSQRIMIGEILIVINDHCKIRNKKTYNSLYLTVMGKMFILLTTFFFFRLSPYGP